MEIREIIKGFLRALEGAWRAESPAVRANGPNYKSLGWSEPQASAAPGTVLRTGVERCRRGIDSGCGCGGA